MWLLLSLAACNGSDQNIEKQYPEASVDPSTIDFGDVAVEYSSSSSINLINSGRAVLNIDSVTTDDVLGAYSVGEVPPTLDPGGVVSIPVTFHPPDYTDYTATLTITSDDPDFPELPVVLTGRGAELPTPDIAVDPTSLDFGTVPSGSMNTLWFTVSNEGDGPLEVTGTDQVGSGAFSIIGDSAFTVAPGGSTNIVVLYTPTTDLGDNGTLTFHANDPDEPDTTVYMIGNGGGDFAYPVAVIDGPDSITPRETISLDGSGSYDPGGFTPLTYQWSLVSVPDGSQALLSDPDNLDHVYLPTDVAGVYTAKLQVTNSIGLVGAPAYYTVDAIPDENFHVELSWNTGGADLDLHVLTSAGSFFAEPDDANWCNQTPDWGAAGGADDPSLDIDDQSGWGPENINIDDPADDTYSVKVHYYEDGGDGEVVATVHIYTYGALVGTYSKVLERNDVWDVAQVRWPDGVAIEETTDLYSASHRGCYNP